MSRSQRGKKSASSKPSGKEKAMAAANAAVDSKALDVKVIELGEIVNYTEYFVIASGTSTRQAQAISDNVRHIIGSYNSRPLGVEGEREGNWILIDWGEVVIHVFYHPVREFYELEKLYPEADTIDIQPED